MKRGGDTPIQKTFIALRIGGDGSPFGFGELKNNSEIVFESNESGQPLVANIDGVVVGEMTGYPGQFTYSLKPKLDAALGIDSTSSTVVSTLFYGEDVPNWSDYQKIL